MAKLKTQAIAMNSLIAGWGYVEGRWVYVPLWDPPYEFQAFRYLIAANAIADGAKLLADKEMSAKLHSFAGGLLKRANEGMVRAFEEGDSICPTWPRPHWPLPWPPFPWPWPPTPWPPFPWPGPDPGPLEKFIEALHDPARNAVIGSLVSQIGEMINEKDLMNFGNEIMQSR